MSIFANEFSSGLNRNNLFKWPILKTLLELFIQSQYFDGSNDEVLMLESLNWTFYRRVYSVSLKNEN